jgi:hypothetical protein
VLFIHHDELQIRHRRKHGHARAQHDARFTTVRCQPIFQALRGREAEVAGHGRFVKQIPEWIRALERIRPQAGRQTDDERRDLFANTAARAYGLPEVA